MLLDDYPAIPLSFVAGPAVLANVCAILQNGVNIRYGQAVDQWRNFHALLAGRDSRLIGLYSDPDAALELSGRRVRLQLRALELLVSGTVVFGVTSLFALGWSILAEAQAALTGAISAATIMSATGGLLILLSVAVTVMQETACARRLMRLHVTTSINFKASPGDGS